MKDDTYAVVIERLVHELRKAFKALAECVKERREEFKEFLANNDGLLYLADDQSDWIAPKKIE